MDSIVIELSAALQVAQALGLEDLTAAFQQILCWTTVAILVGYSFGLFQVMVIDAFSSNRRTEGVQIVPIVTWAFALIFLFSIAFGIDDFSARVFTAAGENDPLLLFALQVAASLSISAFVWAFARSFYIISLLDAGLWGEVIGFRRIIDKSSLSEKTVEALLRLAIIFSFFNHQILLASLINIDPFGEKSTAETLIPWLAAVQPVVEDLFNMTPTIPANGPSLNGEILVGVGRSGVIVLSSIWIWSLWTSRLFKKHRAEIKFKSEGDERKFEASLSLFRQQQAASFALLVIAFYIGALSILMAAEGDGSALSIAIIFASAAGLASLYLFRVVFGQNFRILRGILRFVYTRAATRIMLFIRGRRLI